MACNENLSNICVDPIKATCVDYDNNLGSNTTIVDDCVNQDMVNVDLYTLVDGIIANSDTVNLSGNCLTYPLTGGAILTSTAMETHGTEICDNKNRLDTLEALDYSALDITGWGLDFDCLVDPCGDPITTLGQLIQIMITTDCL